MPSTEIVRIRNCIHITVISYLPLEVMSKSVSLKVLRLKMVKLECMIIQLDLDTIKKARNKLDGACGIASCINNKTRQVCLKYEV